MVFSYIYWGYIFQYTIDQIIGRSLFSDPFEFILIGIWIVGGIFLAGLIWELYKNYKRTESVESLLFMIGLLLILIALLFFNFAKFSYASLGSPELGDFLTITTQYPVIAGALCINIFAVRTTFPKHSKIVFSILLILAIIFLGTQGYLDEIPISQIDRLEQEFYQFMDSKYARILKDIAKKKEIDENLQTKLISACEDFISCLCV